MPIFEYKCTKCGFVNEALIRSANSDAPACPQCGSKKTEKIVSTFAAVVKENTASPAPQKCQTCPNAGQCSDFAG